MVREFTNILIINGWSINVQNATGITMRSIFQYWNESNWYEISCSPTSVESTYHNKKVYALPHKYYPIYFILNMPIFRKINTFSKDHQSKLMINKKRPLASTLRRILIAYADSLILIPPKKLLDRVKEEFEPDYIYTLGGSILSLKLALYFSKKFNIRIVMHFMDNWPDTLYSESVFLYPCHWYMKKILRKVYDRMDMGLTISEKMARKYDEVWNKKHYALMNTVPQISESPNINDNTSDIRIVYAGGLHLERWKSLLIVNRVIDSLNINNNYNIILDIYTSDKDRQQYSHLFIGNNVKFNSYLPHDQVLLLYQNSDILLHIESFDSQIIKTIEYSLSTKISEYLASGKPILLFAPKKIAVTEYIEENKAGLTASNEKEVYDSFNQLVASKELRYQLASNAIYCAKKNHSPNETENKLRMVFGC